MSQSPEIEIVVEVKFRNRHTGFCRSYYKGVGSRKGRLYCLQDADNQGRREWLICSSDGEPECPLREGITVHDSSTGLRWKVGQDGECVNTDEYFIVKDQWPDGFELMYGDPEQARGFSQARARTIKELVSYVPKEHAVYRVYLHRTEGKEGVKLIKDRGESKDAESTSVLDD